jgi:hypothetical protein
MLHMAIRLRGSGCAGSKSRGRSDSSAIAATSSHACEVSPISSFRLRDSEESDAADPTPQELITGMLPKIRRKLSALDDERLVGVLAAGDIRLLRVSWLLAQPHSFRMERRQLLEQRESEREEPPFLAPQEAVALILEGTRGVGAFTYGWWRA